MGILKVETKKEGDVLVESLYHDSSNILKSSYNYKTNQLRITFKKGSVYGYTVPKEIYEQFKTSESVGKYFNGTIKNNYTASKIGDISVDLLTELENKLTTYKKPNE